MFNETEMTVPFALIIKHFMIICIIIKLHCKRLFQTQDWHGVFTAYKHNAHNAPNAL